MRILMVAWEYPPVVLHGEGSLIAGLATELARDGHDVVVISPRHASHLPHDAEIDGVRVLRADVDLPWIPPEDQVAAVSSANHRLVGMASVLAGWVPDVVHVHDWYTAWAGDVFSRLWDVPLVATIHGTERERHGGHLPPGSAATINSIEWWLAERADAVVCCSAFMRRAVLDDFELHPDHVHLIPNGVNPALWAPPDGSIPREPLVVAWGRVRYEKGFQALANAMALVRQRVPDVRCIIAGRGPYAPELQLQIDVEGVGDVVQLAGYLDDKRLRQLLYRAGCAVIPSLHEPFGVVALEAMAAGAPIVAARTGGLAEIVAESDAGLLFEPGNVEQLADRITAVLNDPELALSLHIGAARLLRDRYSWDAIARATSRVYAVARSATRSLH